MDTHIVNKPFEVNGVVLPAGAPVDASAWKHTEKLVGQRYLRAIDTSEMIESHQRHARATDSKPGADMKLTTASTGATKVALEAAIEGAALRAGERKMVEVLAQAYPASLDRKALVKASGLTIKASTVRAYLSTLRKKALVTTDGVMTRLVDALTLPARRAVGET